MKRRRRSLAVTIAKNGQPSVVRLGRRVRESCCDCGLVHVVVYELALDGELVIRAWRDDESSAELRQKSKRFPYRRRK